MLSVRRGMRRSVLILSSAFLLVAVTPGATAADDPAVAHDDTATTTEDTAPIHIDVLANDTDADGGPFVVTGVSGGTRGTSSVGAGGADVIYATHTDEFGVDVITYTITGGSSATITVEIEPVNDPPDAVDDNFEVVGGWGPQPVRALANDTDDSYELSYVTTSTSAHGTVTIYPDNPWLWYQPTSGYFGPDSFTYTISDGNGGTDTATVSLQVVPDTEAPIAFAPWVQLIKKPIGSSTAATRVYWRIPDVNFGSGLASQQLQVSVNGGTYTNVQLPKPSGGEVIDRVTQILRVDRTYQYRLRATDRAGNVSDWAIDQPFIVKRFQENTSLATYAGHWSRSYQSNASGGAVYRTSQAGASVTFTFNGTDFAIVATTTPTSGTAKLNFTNQLVNFRSSTNRWHQVVWAFHFGHTTARHTITLTATGNGRVDVDAFAVLR